MSVALVAIVEGCKTARTHALLSGERHAEWSTYDSTIVNTGCAARRVGARDAGVFGRKQRREPPVGHGNRAVAHAVAIADAVSNSSSKSDSGLLGQRYRSTDVDTRCWRPLPVRDRHVVELLVDGSDGRGVGRRCSWFRSG